MRLSWIFSRIMFLNLTFGLLLSVAYDARAAGPETVATLDGKPILREQVERRAANKLYRLKWEIYDTLKSESEKLANELLLETEAKRRKISVDELLRLEVDEKSRPPTAREVEEYIRSNKVPGIPGDDVHARISKYLGDRGRIQRRLDFLRELRDKSTFEFLLTPPERPRTEVSVDDDPLRGDVEAPVTIIHFASFTCEICAESARKIQRLTEEFPGRIRWVHRDFINIFDENGLAFAEAAETAHANGRFWDFHDHVYSLSGEVEVAGIGEILSQIGIEKSEYEKAHKEATYLMEIKHDIEDGVAAGVTSVPVLFINGRYASGTFSYESLRGLVEEELGSLGKVSKKQVVDSP